MAEGFRGPQVCKIVGITYRQLDYWARTDLLRPSISDARGSGTQRVYSYTDLLKLKVIKQLLDSGLSLTKARIALDVLSQYGEDAGSANLVMAGNQPVLVRGDDELVDLLRGGQGVLSLVLPLAGVVAELDAAITAFEPAAASGGDAADAGAGAGAFDEAAPRKAGTGG
jgi:DNA-binding transcriptional MerR regulator